MRETITPTKGQSSTPKMRTTQLYQFISIYLIIFKSLTCTNSQTIDQKTLQKLPITMYIMKHKILNAR